VVEAVNGALAAGAVPATSYCLCPAWDDRLPGYVLLVESAELPAGEVPEARLAAEVDRRLAALNVEYAGKRRSGRLAPVRVRRIADGSWSRYDHDTAAQRRRGMEQYKHKFLVADVAFERGFPAVDSLAAARVE
jgi:hypothetical protein